MIFSETLAIYKQMLTSSSGRSNRNDKQRALRLDRPQLPDTTHRVKTRTTRQRSASPASQPVTLTRLSKRSFLTQSEFEICRKTLQCVILCCSDTEFLRLSTIISCLLWCFQPLHQSELITICGLFNLRAEDAGEGAATTQLDNLALLAQKCRKVIHIDSAGVVQFAHPLIRAFLQSCPVKGIDRTHFTIAKACLLQVEADGNPRPWEVPSSVAPASFAAYAARHWQDHYRYIQVGHAGMTGRVHLLLEKHLGPFSSDACEHSQNLCRARALCDQLGFKVLGNMYAQVQRARNAASQHAPAQEEEAESSYECSEVGSCALEGAFEDLNIENGEGCQEPGWMLV